MIIIFIWYIIIIWYLLVKINDEYYVHVCSLGTLCHSTKIIMNNKLKLESYPFDWIYSNPKNVLHMIEDDFKTFLDKSFYIGKKLRAGHKEYDDNLFNHHNPKDNEVQYNYFVRCVNRFRRLLKTRQKKLFVSAFLNCSFENFFECKEQVLNIKNALDRRTKNFRIFVLFHIPSKNIRHFLFTQDDMDFCLLYTSHSDGLKFNRIKDNEYINQILKKKYMFDVCKLN